MSQRGARYAASIGKTYREILAFYYPGTEINTINKGGGLLIAVVAFINQVLIPLLSGWGYIYQTHGKIWTAADQKAATRAQTKQYGSQWIGKMVTDCSGLIYWACMELGVKVVWHARYLYTDWCKVKGKLSGGKRTDGGTLLPGSLVFLQGKEDHIHHVGVYIGRNTCVEAKGTRWGVVTSELSHWDHWGQLKVVDYTGAEELEDMEWKAEETVDTSIYATANNPRTWLNIRTKPSESSSRVNRVQKGTVVKVLDMSNPEWWLIEYNGKTGYASAKYLALNEQETAEDQKPYEPENEVEEPELPEETAVEPEPEKKESLIDRIKGFFGRKDEPQTEELEDIQVNVPVQDEPISDADVLVQIKSVAADLAILTRLVDEAQNGASVEQLIEILTALDKVLPAVEETKNSLWQTITVG